jgi:hypothetical protein
MLLCTHEQGELAFLLPLVVPFSSSILSWNGRAMFLASREWSLAVLEEDEQYFNRLAEVSDLAAKEETQVAKHSRGAPAMLAPAIQASPADTLSTL